MQLWKRKRSEPDEITLQQVLSPLSPTVDDFNLVGSHQAMSSLFFLRWEYEVALLNKSSRLLHTHFLCYLIQLLTEPLMPTEKVWFHHSQGNIWSRKPPRNIHSFRLHFRLGRINYRRPFDTVRTVTAAQEPKLPATPSKLRSMATIMFPDADLTSAAHFQFFHPNMASRFVLVRHRFCLSIMYGSEFHLHTASRSIRYFRYFQESLLSRHI
jgi:hypothetical protein